MNFEIFSGFYFKSRRIELNGSGTSRDGSHSERMTTFCNAARKLIRGVTPRSDLSGTIKRGEMI